MGLFDGLKGAELFEKGKFFVPGFNGVVEIKKTLAKKSRKSGVGFIVEVEVIDTNLPDEHPEGSKATWWQGMKDTTVAFPAIKAFMAAIGGYTVQQKEEIEEHVSPHIEETVDAACESPDDNDLIGELLCLETYHKKTQKGGDFTVYDWTPYVEAD